jgi:hypothetical protein
MKCSFIFIIKSIILNLENRWFVKTLLKNEIHITFQIISLHTLKIMWFLLVRKRNGRIASIAKKYQIKK